MTLNSDADCDVVSDAACDIVADADCDIDADARGLSALWASRRASAQAVTSKWQLRTTSPMNTNSSVGENWFLAKNGSWPGRL